MTTIYEVAKDAGVSPATVSRVFNNLGVSEQRKKAVLASAKKLDFTPNRTARTLRKQTSEVIALVIPDIENPHFTELARGVEDVTNDAGFSVVLCNSDEQPSKEANYLRVAVSEQMAGVIIAPSTPDTDLSVLAQAGRPVVIVDRTLEEDTDGVVADDFSAGKVATESLLSSGYERIACITGPADIGTAQKRSSGWSFALEQETGSLPDPSLLYHADFRLPGGEKGIEHLLRLPCPPDAVVVTNNLMGAGALRALTARGLTPPKFGVAVIGSLPLMTLAPDAVTTVSIPARHMGVTAARILLERIGGDAQPTRTVMLRNELQPMSGRKEIQPNDQIRG